MIENNHHHRSAWSYGCAECRRALLDTPLALDILTRRPDLADMAAPGVVRAMALRSEA